MGEVRPATPADLRQMAEIDLAEGVTPGHTEDDARRAYDEVVPELVFGQPYAQHASPSLVFEHEGAVVGFVLVGCQPVVFGGERRWLAVTSHLGVLEEARSTLAGVHLLRAVTDGPQDLVYVDRSNEAGRVALQAAGFEQFPTHSLRWSKVLRPGASAARRVATRLPLPVGRALDVARQLEGAGPQRLQQRTIVALPPLPKTIGTQPLTADGVAGAAPKVTAGYDLHSELEDVAHLESLWAIMERSRAVGEMASSMVVNRRGDVLGWYLAHINNMGTADVAQLYAAPAHAKVVLLQLLHDMQARGAVEVEGDLPMSLLYATSDIDCEITAVDAATSVFSNDPKVLQSFRDDRALLSQLEGEYLVRPLAGVQPQ